MSNYTYKASPCASNRTQSFDFEVANSPIIYNDLEAPDLIPDCESDDESVTDFEDSANSIVSSRETFERSNIMSLIVLITSKEIRRRGLPEDGICTFLTDLIRRSNVSLNQYLINLIILQRLFANELVIDDHRKLILYSFMLGSTSIDFNLWCKITGFSKPQLTSDLIQLGHHFGGLGPIRIVSTEEIQSMKDLLETEVKKYVKVI
ncbi:DEKNAAC105005 [Brettanomyces naardenensis]|uniref:DEKNAAC105005 n=1 Tax=Brettanomyces naardenensis TaxID=13370 RepID=A0A448YS58_BRENA|nr:DEKNAAC105005 [Brettanomyces naardenensis]